MYYLTVFSSSGTLQVGEEETERLQSPGPMMKTDTEY